MRNTFPSGDRRGAALIMALLISVAIAAMALGAIVVASGANLTTLFAAKEATLQAAADGGLAMIRDTVNRGTFDSLLPDSGYTTIVTDAPVLDAFGHAYSGITRSLYVGRTGGRTGGAATAGQYGSNFASGVSIISNTRGAVAARRLLMTQDSWAKYAVAINNWSNVSNYYGCDEAINGPFFSNNYLVIQSGSSGACATSKTLFASSVNVAGFILNPTNGNFRDGYSIGVPPITWPTPAKIALMQKYAQDADAAGGDYDITSASVGTKKPSVRIEFVTIDVNGNGVIDWDEGFMRVWKAANTSDSALAYATGKRWPNGAPSGAATTSDPNMVSRNCGAQTTISGVTQFYTAAQIYYGAGGGAATVQNALTSGTRRCYLGGDPHLFEPTTGDTLTPAPALTNSAVWGSWLPRRNGPLGSLAAKRSGDAAYLIPLGSNANFKGVIFVTGDVAISGQLRGRLSIFATGNIVLADDLTYYIAPGTECDAQGDIMGAIATKDVVIEDNNLQTPFYVTSPSTGIATAYGGFDDTNDANYNMFILATGSSSTTDGNWYGEWVQSPWSAPVNLRYGASVVDASAIAQRCGQAANGCVRVSGGIAEGRFDNATFIGSGSSANFGWGEKHTYDPCGAIVPPPYFPTTGRFTESRYYEVDPVWLKQMTIGDYFRRLRAQ